MDQEAAGAPIIDTEKFDRYAVARVVWKVE
jgi:hypothetical protein